MRPYLSVCAIYRDEAPYLREWVAFHRLVGVERFFLYNNRSQDAHREALAPFIDEGSVVLCDWPLWPGQLQAYDHCIEHHRDSRWIAFIDLDEFLFSPTGRPVPEILVDYERWSGVGVNWANFGTSGHRTRPPGLVLESYMRRTNTAWINSHYKSIVDPTRVARSGNPHFFVYREGFAVDENHRPIKGPRLSFTDSVSFSKLRVNHYATKSEQEYERKLSRGKADTTVPKTMPYATAARRDELLGEQHDETITAYLPALRQALADLEPGTSETGPRPPAARPPSSWP